MLTKGIVGLIDDLQPVAMLAARLCLAWIFIVEGLEKIGSYQAVGAYMEANGVRAELLPLVIVTELGGGLMVACGFFTRFAAIALAGFCLLTAIFFHAHFDDASQTIEFNKNIAIAGGFIGLVAVGGGRFSLDALIAYGSRVSRRIGETADEGRRAPESASGESGGRA